MVFYVAIIIDNSKDKTKQQLRTYIVIAELYRFVNVLHLDSALLP